jgi:glycosyltransferase involved in cell wall biosynthesis
MWDQARGYDLEWWSRLPKNLRVVSFSNEISQRSRAVGLNTLDVRYSMFPVDGEQADWGKPRTLFYWNRTGMVGEAFLRELCETINVEVLLFRHRIDPRVPSWCDYELPKKLGKAVVKELAFAPGGANAHREYLKYLNQANIFIAPRLSEGVGLSFIEALARGCAVFAYDAPNMNEYITHKTNGYLLQQRNKSAFNTIQEQMTKQLRRVASRFGYESPSFEYPVTERQNWAEIKKLDLQALGNKARQGQLEGYAAWKNILPQYASFILDW